VAVTALNTRRLGILLAPLIDILAFCVFMSAGLSLRAGNTYAFAIGYDWLYNALTPEERGTIRDAIVTKALDPVMAVYQKPGAWSGNRPAAGGDDDRRNPVRRSHPLCGRALRLTISAKSRPEGAISRLQVACVVRPVAAILRPANRQEPT